MLTSPMFTITVLHQLRINNSLVWGSNWYVFKAWPSKNGASVCIQLEFQARGPRGPGTRLMLRAGTSPILWLPDQELGTGHVHNDLSCPCGSSENTASSQLPMQVTETIGLAGL